MSLEEAVLGLEKTIAANTAAILAGRASPTPAAAADGGGKRPPGRPKAVSLDDVKAIAEKVRDEKGRPAAVALIKEHGADSLAELGKEKYAAFIAAAEVVLQGGDEGEAAGDEAAL